jgi:predicted regulator of Ras-like GTPase activity (Roadblock/LC7/MglB family)
LTSVPVPDHDDRDLNWLVTSFAHRIAGVTSVVVLSTDGLVLAVSDGLARATAETLAAVTAGLASLTAGAARHMGTGTVNQVIVEMDGGYLFVTTVSEGSALAVMSGPDADIGQVGYEMSVLVARIGNVLTPALRAELSSRPDL